MACQMEVELEQPTLELKTKSECAEDYKRDFKPKGTWDDLLGNILQEFVYYQANPKRCNEELQLLNSSKMKVQADLASISDELRKAKQYERELPSMVEQCLVKCEVLELELKPLEAMFRDCNVEHEREGKLFTELNDIIDRVELKLLMTKLDFYSKDKTRCQLLVDHGLNAEVPRELLHEIATLRESLKQIEEYLGSLKQNLKQKHRDFARIEAKRQDLLKELNECRRRLDYALAEKHRLGDKLQKMPKMIHFLQEQLKASIRSESALSKAILKMTFVNSLIAAEEKEKLMLEAVDLEVDLLKKFAPR